MEYTLYANEIGDGYPILIIHGWQMNGQVEEAAFEPIFVKTQGFRRIYVDLPGMGRTPASGIQNVDDIYLRLVQFIDTRLHGSKFMLIGTSLGGHLARAIAQKYETQVDGLLLRVPLIQPDDRLRDLDVFQPIVASEQLVSSLSSIDRALLGDILIQTPEYIKALKLRAEESWSPAEQMADNNTLTPIRLDPERYKLSTSLEPRNNKFLAPTLIVCGRHDPVVGYRDSIPLLELYPRSTFVVLDRGTHGIPIDEGIVFEALVHDWLIRVAEWRLHDVRL